MNQTDHQTSSQINTCFNDTPGIAILNSLGVLRVYGANAHKLLHGQATSHIESMQQGDIRFAAACSPKGRIYATFYVIHQGEHCDLVMPRSTIETTKATLSKYAPLYRCQLEDVSEQYLVTGLNQAATEQLLSNGDTTDGLYPLSEESRSLLILPSDQSMGTDSLNQIDENGWHLLSIRLARVLVEQEHSDTFIPQMLNYQATGAISFKKGCYTGQEIIARAQYRGGVKKRIQHLVIRESEAIAVGTLIYASEDNTPEVGEVLLSAVNEQGNQELLAVIKDSALEHSLHVSNHNSIVAELQPLPYPLDKRDI
ncbi:CAF17-like 4Fe-4S cluster assembly/insertion protein YgfZ [Oceanospirillum sediminis]|uniref:Folate-binding protein YgfZ n=1 Tax=Oceanospirillum sediminis TaxID=2760088 RepID=A0A839IXE1_9GAMM|nr:folate-binding protein YgfZ [Oceanospirillum sediminis]MBB1489462.1 folate-binding protein YgfZ [Oceanospirillum sediminis]